MEAAIKTVNLKIKRKTSAEQFDLLRAEMAIHTAAAFGYGSGRDRAVVDAEWKEIAEKLNALGPPQRTLSEWKKVWSDVRLRSKRSLCEEFQQKNKSNYDEDLISETLNNASMFYNSQNSSEQDYDADQENSRVILPAVTADVNEREKRIKERNNRKKQTTPEQFRLLKSEMTKHPLAAKGYATGKSRHKVDQEWRDILDKLNELGPPYRTMTEWKKVWSDVRLRVKKNLGKPPKKGKSRRIKRESESEDDNFAESMNDNNSSYANAGTFEMPQIVQTQLDDSNDISESYLTSQKNPLNDNEYRNRNNEETKTFHHDFEISEMDGTQFNDVRRPQTQDNNVMNEAFSPFQMQTEQYDNILQHLTKISTSMSEVMHQQVAALKRKNLLMEHQVKTDNFNKFLKRRQELRQKRRSKICDWF